MHISTNRKQKPETRNHNQKLYWLPKIITTDEEMELATTTFPYNTPATKEAYYYRTIFHKYYPQLSAAQTVRKWIPKWQENQDPSGRANAAHVQADVEIAKSSVSTWT